MSLNMHQEEVNLVFPSKTILMCLSILTELLLMSLFFNLIGNLTEEDSYIPTIHQNSFHLFIQVLLIYHFHQ